MVKVNVPSFGTSPNDHVTAAGVALLSLAHHLSAYSHNANMAASLASASKMDSVGKFQLKFFELFFFLQHLHVFLNLLFFFLEDVASWWIEKCASSVQNCFVDGVGDVAGLSPAAGRQFAVDYGMRSRVF